jgi:hypothetical protein
MLLWGRKDASSPRAGATQTMLSATIETLHWVRRCMIQFDSSEYVCPVESAWEEDPLHAQ